MYSGRLKLLQPAFFAFVYAGYSQCKYFHWFACPVDAKYNKLVDTIFTPTLLTKFASTTVGISFPVLTTTKKRLNGDNGFRATLIEGECCGAIRIDATCPHGGLPVLCWRLAFDHAVVPLREVALAVERRYGGRAKRQGGAASGGAPGVARIWPSMANP